MLPTYDDGKAVAIDYETYFSTRDGYSLSMMTPWAYVHDKRFDPYLVAVCGEDIFDPELAKEPESPDYTLYRNLEDGRQLYVGRPEHFKSWPKLFNRIILAHNAAFDQIVTLRCAELGIIPELTGTQWQCTADMTAYLMVNRSLKDAMKWLFGKEISKAVRSGMDGRHEYELNDGERRDLVAYGGSDAVECHDLWLKYSCRWPEIERKISCQNRDAIRRGFRIDRSYAEKCLKSLKSLQAAVLPDIPWVSRVNPKTGTFYAAGSLPALRQEVVNLGVDPPKSFKKDDPGFLDWLKEHNDIPFIKARATYAGTVQHVARIENLIASADENDLVRPGLVYFGAATGRFAAGLGDDSKAKNINMLNLPRAPLFKGDPRVMDGKGIDLRGMYIPRPGYKFVIFDYSQIEARFALWLVGDTHMMEALKKEGNLYQANAVAMGWCGSGADLKHTDPDKYRLAKCCLHGDTPILVRSEKKDGGLTKPYYKRIICVTSTDRVWDGHEWVRHLGVERMKEVKNEELVEIGGVCLTRDHKVYIGETESRRADEILGDEQAAAMAWGDTHNPVRGWAHVRILATYLAGACTRALGLCTREALHILTCALRLHGVRGGDVTPVGQRPEGAYDEVRKVRAQGITKEGRGEHVGEDAR